MVNSVDWQAVADAFGGVCVGLGGWALGIIWREIKDLGNRFQAELMRMHQEQSELVRSLPETYARRQEHSELVRSLPETYARRDEVKAGFDRIEAALERIFDKLDTKADRPKR